ncbi:MAG: patatin-like phospholipase family protein [Syntrophales bacterium]|jgi:NTE family protein|nr:patatin-like phospholipase family protein [Syntrophales bacterium]MCK9527304.1 patatin-like phospholipase family protein [Syntrophales bacterium]MDX9921226.1 patatin-like phospholipase family protein [Syntrophales bacterium]
MTEQPDSKNHTDARGKKKRSGGNKTEIKSVNLALQGGGSHGAFTWGVLDRLLEDGRIVIEGISGTSAGAMNAVVVADGLMRGHREGARRALHDFWHAVSAASIFSPIQRTPADIAAGRWNLDLSPGFMLFDMLERSVSPYLLNPLNINPLRELLASRVDFERVRSCDKVKLFISATNVRTGHVKVFERSEMTVDMVMASACLPFLSQAVEIDGDAYWDGGYMGNPVLYPFAYRCRGRDVVIVQINPLYRHDIPRTAQEILNRVNEITFNGSLMKELRAIEFVGRLLDAESLDPGRYKKMLIHMIDFDAANRPLNVSSKLNAGWDFLTFLHREGRHAAAEWLDRHYDSLGRESSLDVRSLFS